MLLRNDILACCCAVVLLSGCGTVAKAPVSARGTAPAPQARIVQPQGAAAVQRNASATDYVVRRGDTLYSIAWQHGLKMKELARLNRLRSPYTIYPGQRLRVRAESGSDTAPVARAAPARPPPRPQPVPAPGPSAPAATPVPAPTPASARMAGDRLYDGKWQWPTRGKLLRGYQENTNGKKGIDIGGYHGQPVTAAAGGKVVYVGSGLVGYGRLIIIKHNDSLLSAYGHNSKLVVAEGDQVRAGQLIANMGSSGTDHTALYFEIRRDGKPVDPLQFLPRQ
ncbi:MAG: peptidoglycan DD-metalloendopeptidase family protein [Pseudomonadota bacterium]